MDGGHVTGVHCQGKSLWQRPLVATECGEQETLWNGGRVQYKEVVISWDLGRGLKQYMRGGDLEGYLFCLFILGRMSEY